MKEMHLTEGRNTGFRKILNALERNGSPKPVFETDPDRLSFATTLHIHPYFLLQNEEENEEEKVSLTTRELAVIKLIEKNANVSIATLVTDLQVSKSTVERILNSLKKKKIIAREGGDKGGKWILL